MDYPPIYDYPKKWNFAIRILTCHVNGQRYVQKHFFGCVAWKLRQKIKFRPAILRKKIEYWNAQID